MSLHKFAEQVAAQGRGDDSLLVHMTPDEVQRLQAFAEANGRTMTINPETGLPEAGFLSDLFKAVAPIALGAFLGPAGAAIGGGFMSAGMAGLTVGGITTLATGSLSRGLMAGLGAYGGAGLGESLMSAGTGAGMTEALAGSSTGNLGQAFGDVAATATDGSAGSAFNKFLTSNANPATMSGADLASSGFKAAATDPLAFAKSNLGNLGYAAAPILAGAMVPTTTKAPETKNTNYIRQFDFNINPITGRPDPLYGVRSMAPVKASEFGDKTFQGQRDIFRQQNPNPNPYDIGVASLNQPPQQQMGMAGGGIVALARGGVAHYEDGGSVDYFDQQFAPDVFAPAATQAAAPNYDQVIADAYATIGRSGVGEGTSQIDQGGYNHFLNMLQTGQVAPESFNDVFQGAVTRYIADNPNDRYTQYVNEYRGNQADTGGGGVTNLATTGGGAATVADTSGIATLNNTGATTGGTNLAAFNNSYTGANINDYIANNALDAAGIATAAKQFNVNPADIVAAQNAQQIVTNVYRNVLGRDPDPAGLSWWTNQIMNGDRTGAEMYESFKQSAKQTLGSEGTKEIFKDLSLTDATKDYVAGGGYKSADTRTIADEWVRNTLGREVTEADRKTQWYKDASDSTKMKTVNIAEDIYGKFKNFARDDAAATAAKKITEAKTLLTSKGLSEMDVLRQTGKTIAELVGSDIKLENDLFKASQLLKPGQKAGFDFNAITKPVVKSDFSNTVTPGGYYGNNTGNPLTTTPGDITQNADGTVTVQPNIPGRPTGGFTGIQQIKDAYTAGGGSLGFTSRVPKSIDEFNQMYNKQTGDSEAAYNFLMGKGAARYPMKTVAPNVASSYAESVLGKKTSALKAAPTANDFITIGDVKYDLTNPATKPPADSKGTWTWNTFKKRWLQVAADGTVISDGGGGGGVGGESGGPNGGGGGNLGGGEGGGDLGGGSAGGAFALAAAGGMMGYAVGGGLGSLGSYSDGGRLLKGPGDGVSDSIPATIGRKQQPARLADGEFVIPARIVSELGNGSTDAGAKKLYAMMDRVQRARGKTTGKNKVAANSRADKYLPA
jgi:hypothetical protein